MPTRKTTAHEITAQSLLAEARIRRVWRLIEAEMRRLNDARTAELTRSYRRNKWVRRLRRLSGSG